MLNDLPEEGCKAVAVQNSSQWPCSMCPILQLRLVGVRMSSKYIYFNISWTTEFWTPLQIPICPPTLAAPRYINTRGSGGIDWLSCLFPLFVPMVILFIFNKNVTLC